MAKEEYVCDFAKVRAIGENIVKLAEELDTSKKNYDQYTTEALSGWDSPTAKLAFQSVNDELLANVDILYQYITELGNYITGAADNIETYEGDLSNINI